MTVGALACFASTASATPFRCVVNGKTVYQQIPCDGGEKVNVSGAGKPDLNSPAALQAQRDISALEYKRRVDDAISRNSVFVGMHRNDVVRSWGYPHKINTTRSTYGGSEQWIYRRGRIGYDQYLYVENDVVSTIQSSD